MRLGAMNHPMRDVVEEVRRFRALGFDFVDLTLEPERARADRLDLPSVARVLAETGLAVVGHTAWYLPIASPFPGLRRAALDELERCFDAFARLGADRVNVHPDPSRSMFPVDSVVALNAESLATLSDAARARGLRLMVENLPGTFSRIDVLRRLFDAAPSLGWHLDVGHANLYVPTNTTDVLLAAFAARLSHVHLSDNKGGEADLHLPIGAGNVDWRWALGQIKRRGYDDTITLEVFSPDEEYLALSATKVRRIWADAESPGASSD